MTTDNIPQSTDDRPADDETPTTAASAEDGGSTETAGALLESAAEIAIGAAVAPFTGGETVGIVATITEALEGGVDRLTHLGHPHDAPTIDADGPGSTGHEDPPA